MAFQAEGHQHICTLGASFRLHHGNQIAGPGWKLRTRWGPCCSISAVQLVTPKSSSTQFHSDQCWRPLQLQSTVLLPGPRVSLRTPFRDAAPILQMRKLRHSEGRGSHSFRDRKPAPRLHNQGSQEGLGG